MPQNDIAFTLPPACFDPMPQMSIMLSKLILGDFNTKVVYFVFQCGESVLISQVDKILLPFYKCNLVCPKKTGTRKCEPEMVS